MVSQETTSVEMAPLVSLSLDHRSPFPVWQDIVIFCTFTAGSECSPLPLHITDLPCN